MGQGNYIIVNVWNAANHDAGEDTESGDDTNQLVIFKVLSA